MPTFDDLTVVDPSFLRGAVSGPYISQPLIPTYTTNFFGAVPTNTGIWSNGDFNFDIVTAFFGVQQIYVDAVNIPYFWTELTTLPDKTTLNSMTVHVKADLAAALPTIKPKIELWKRTVTTITQVGLTITDPSVTNIAFTTEHDITLSGLTEVIDNSTWSRYFLKFLGMDNTVVGPLFILGVSVSTSP